MGRPQARIACWRKSVKKSVYINSPRNSVSQFASNMSSPYCRRSFILAFRTGGMSFAAGGRDRCTHLDTQFPCRYCSGLSICRWVRVLYLLRTIRTVGGTVGTGDSRVRDGSELRSRGVHRLISLCFSVCSGLGCGVGSRQGSSIWRRADVLGVGIIRGKHRVDSDSSGTSGLRRRHLPC